MLPVDELGLPDYVVPFLAPNAMGKTTHSAMNYASKREGILISTGRIFVSILSLGIFKLIKCFILCYLDFCMHPCALGWSQIIP